MNNIADFIPAFALVSAGLGVIAAAGLMWFEHIAERRSSGYDRLRFPQPAPRSAPLVQRQDGATASANAASLQAAA
jgi:hypothetical protein